MFKLILSIFIGVIAGIILKNKEYIVKFSSRLLQLAVFALLYLMGIKIAIKKEVFLTQKSLLFEALVSSIILFVIFIIFILIKKLILVLIFKIKRNETKSSFLINKNEQGNNKEINSKANKSFTKNEIFSVLINVGFIIMGFLTYYFTKKIFSKDIFNDNLINNSSEVVLIALLFFVGLDLGKNMSLLKKQRLKINHFLLPFESIALTFVSSIIFCIIFSKKYVEGMIIYGGLGWYSLSSVLLSLKGLTVLAIYSFIHNVCRELIAIISAPLVAKIDPDLPILLGGATSMDVMLPFVQKYSGQIYTLASFFSGAICSISVSFIINSLIKILN